MLPRAGGPRLQLRWEIAADLGLGPSGDLGLILLGAEVPLQTPQLEDLRPPSHAHISCSFASAARYRAFVGPFGAVPAPQETNCDHGAWEGLARRACAERAAALPAPRSCMKYEKLP